MATIRLVWRTFPGPKDTDVKQSNGNQEQRGGPAKVRVGNETELAKEYRKDRKPPLYSIGL